MLPVTELSSPLSKKYCPQRKTQWGTIILHLRFLKIRNKFSNESKNPYLLQLWHHDKCSNGYVQMFLAPAMLHLAWHTNHQRVPAEKNSHILSLRERWNKILGKIITNLPSHIPDWKLTFCCHRHFKVPCLFLIRHTLTVSISVVGEFG